MTAWIENLNSAVLAKYNTTIRGGFDEPFYRAPADNRPAEIQFTRDYARSALHELAHWCVAGKQRRLLDDYGYWYAPDGRDNEQQQLFFHVETKPQAIEKHFCRALGIPFAVSVDNLVNPAVAGLEEFSRTVDARYRDYLETGLPDRAAAIVACLGEWRNMEISK